MQDYAVPHPMLEDLSVLIRQVVIYILSSLCRWSLVFQSFGTGTERGKSPLILQGGTVRHNRFHTYHLGSFGRFGAVPSLRQS